MMKRLTDLSDEVRLAYHSMVAFAEAVHVETVVSVAMRAVLEYLSHNGDTTVPRIADARGVSRQHIQTIVNDLAADGLVEQSDNPAHRRSHLIGLTAAGRECITALAQAEDEQLIGFLNGSAAVPAADIEHAARTLRALRHGLDTITKTLQHPSSSTQENS